MFIYLYFLIKSNIWLSFLEKILETDRGDFCFMHHAELKIVPLGIKAGYPTKINFENLSDRIDNIKDDLLILNQEVGFVN